MAEVEQASEDGLWFLTSPMEEGPRYLQPEPRSVPHVSLAWWLCCTATSDIRAVELTPSSDGDSPVLPELLGQIPRARRSAR